MNVPSTVSSASALSSTQATFVFRHVSDMVVCNSSSITWNYTGSNTTSAAILSLVISSQSSNRTDGRLQDDFNNVTFPLVQLADPAVDVYNWTKVNVPQGHYIITAYVNMTNPVASNPFFVQNGTDTSCLNPTSSNTVTSPSSSLSPAQTSPASTATSNRGVIAGSVVGGVASSVLIFLIVFFILRRRRSSRPTNWSALIINRKGRRTRSISDVRSTMSISTSAIEAARVRSASTTTSPPSSDLDLSPGAEKMVVNYDSVAFPMPFHSRPPSLASSMRSQRLAGGVGYDVFENGFPLQERGAQAPSSRSVDNLSHRDQPQLDFSIAIPHPPRVFNASSESEPSLASPSRRASRKPVPRYDSSEFETPYGSSEHSSDRVHLPASRKSSGFDPADRPVHYLIPDPPLRRD